MTVHQTFEIPLQGRNLRLGAEPLVMGIINVTPDSFSDGGKAIEVQNALAAARAMIAEGAAVLDIGGESTRPGAQPVSIQQELDRVIPVLDAIAAAGLGVPISIDTRHALVADQALRSGAHIINDVEGLQGDPDMADIATLHDAPVIAMHWDRQRDPADDIMSAMLRFFEHTISIAKKAGIVREKLLLDPGFGFAKSLPENYEILRRLPELAALNYPILSGTSRKSMIGKLLDVPTDQRLAGTIATTVLAYRGGAHIFRVHDVKPNRDALRVAMATLYGPPHNQE